MSISITYEGSNEFPRIVRIWTTSTLSQVTTAGWLNPKLAPQGIYPSDQVEIAYAQNSSSAATDIFDVSITAGVVTFSLSGSSVITPTIQNHIAVYANTSGGLTEDASTAINGGNIQAGLSGTAGYVASFPSTASKGSLRVVAADNAGNTVTQITNASFGQASVLTIPDPAGATANFAIAPAALVNNNLVKASGTAGLVADAGIAASAVQLNTNIKAATTSNIGGAGAGPISVVVAGLTAASVVVATVESSSNPVSVIACTATGTGFDITFSADPGASCLVNYVAFVVAQ